MVRSSRNLLRRRRLMTRFGLRRSTDVDFERVLSSSAPPDVVAELAGFQRKIESLPVDCRIVLVLRRLEDMSLPDIAAATGKSLSTVKRRLAEAEALLAERWDGGTIGQ
jgi:RNA polymerase sigma-70 factor (ECF subfamily)